eukprot:7341787-Prymnesium_polylepis.1
MEAIRDNPKLLDMLEKGDTAGKAAQSSSAACSRRATCVRAGLRGDVQQRGARGEGAARRGHCRAGRRQPRRHRPSSESNSDEAASVVSCCGLVVKTRMAARHCTAGVGRFALGSERPRLTGASQRALWHPMAPKGEKV